MNQIKKAADKTKELFAQTKETYLGKEIVFDEYVAGSAAKLNLKVGEIFMGKYVGMETFNDPKTGKDFTLVTFDDGGAIYSIAGHKILLTFSRNYVVPRGTMCRIKRLKDLPLGNQPEGFSDMKDYSISFEQGKEIGKTKFRKLESPPESIPEKTTEK